MFLQSAFVGPVVIQSGRYQVRQDHRQNFGGEFRLDLASVAGELYLQACTELSVVDPQRIPHQHLGSSHVENDGRILVGVFLLHQSRKLTVQEVAQGEPSFEGAAPFCGIA